MYDSCQFIRDTSYYLIIFGIFFFYVICLFTYLIHVTHCNLGQINIEGKTQQLSLQKPCRPLIAIEQNQHRR